MCATTLAILNLLIVSASAASGAQTTTVYETYGGPCEDFNYHVKNRGLKDPDGNTHVNTLGYTSCKIQVAFSQADPAALQRTQSENKTCLATDISKAKIEATQVVTIMRWNYDQRAISDDCKKELQRIEAGIQSHEAVHVTDCKTIRFDSAKDWAKNPRLVKACADSTQPIEALVKTLHSKIGEEVQGLVAKMGKEMEYRSKETHERIGYGTSSINCSKCE